MSIQLAMPTNLNRKKKKALRPIQTGLQNIHGSS